MPTAVKALDNMSKNLTAEERAARETAEAETLPQRKTVTLKAPAYVRQDKAAARYWRQTIRRMEGITLLDDLDTEILAVYCTMLSRRDALNAQLQNALVRGGEDADGAGDLIGRLQGQERLILSYAEKLGLTPSGRVRLAQKRAEARAVGEIDDLFGD